MRIVIFCISTLYSGAEIYTVNLAKALRARGFEVAIVCAPKSKVASIFKNLAFEVIEPNVWSKLSKKTSIRFLLNIKRNCKLLNELLVENDNAEFVVFQFKGEQILLSLLHFRKYRFKILALEHGPIPFIFRLFPLKPVLMGFYKKSAEVFAVSSRVIDSLEKYGVTARTLPPAVDGRLSELKLDYPRNSSILFAGRLTKKKGIKKFVKMAIQNPDTIFYVAGVGVLNNWVESKCKKYSNLIYFGSVDDISLPLSMVMSVAILSKEKGEGRPLIALEAIQAGRHVFVSEDCSVANQLKMEFQNSVSILRKKDYRQLSSKIEEVSRTRQLSELKTLPDWDEISRIMVSGKS